MKKILATICLIAVFTLMFAPSYAQNARERAEEAYRKRVEFVKKGIGFAAWPRETGKVIVGVDVSEPIIPQLKGLKKVWARDNYSIERKDRATYVKIHKWWRWENDEFLATVVVGSSFEHAKQYLLRSYVETQREPALIKEPGSRFGLKIGNVCLVVPQKDGEGFSSIDFIRHNVVVMLSAKGDIQTDMKAIAVTLDAVLVKNKYAKRYRDLADRPKIKLFSAEKAEVPVGKTVRLNLEIDNPKDLAFRYFWELTAGGVKEGFLNDFEYQATLEGQQRVTVTVVNNLGVYDSKSLGIEVVK